MKNSFLEKLELELRRRNYGDVDNVVSYFAEMIDDRIEGGESEDDVIENLEAPSEIADELSHNGDVRISRESIRIDRDANDGREEMSETFEYVRSIDIDVVAYDIDIRKSSTGQTRLEYTRSKSTYLDVKQEAGTLKIGEKRKDNGIFNFGRFFSVGNSFSMTIYLPEEELVKMKIETVSGDVCIADAFCQDLDIELVSGDLQLGETRCDHAHIKTVSGDIEIDGLSLDSLNMETVSGDIHGEMIAASIAKINTVSGDVECLLAGEQSEYAVTIIKPTKERSMGNGDRRLSIETVSGDVDYSFAE